MSVNVGRLYYTVDAQTEGLLKAEQEIDRSIQKIEREFDGAANSTDKFGRQMTQLKPITKGVKQETDRLGSSLNGVKRFAGIAAAALATVGIGASLQAAVNQVADFQTAMNGLAAVSRATESQMADLEKQARSLGATSQFSAQQAAEAQRFLAQAGFQVNEILASTPGILQLATAGSLDLASAADIASNVLGGMRLEVGQLGRVNDVLAATASRSNTTIEQLGQALSFAAPFAASAGISIEEAAASIGNMSDAGIQASRAGTGLVGVIRQLSNVTSGGEDILDKYGLSIADVNIEARGLGPVLETLRGANLSTADAIALFGSEAGAAAQVLVNDYKGAITDAAGEAERMAGIIEQGLGPAMKSLSSAIAESILQLGDSGLAGGLENVIKTATGVISVWNGMGDAWAEANDVGEESLRVVEGLAAAIQVMSAAAGARAVQAIGGLVAAKAGWTAGTLTLTGALAGLRTVLMTLFGPVGLVVGAATAIYTFRDELGLVQREANQTRLDIHGLAGAFRELEASQRLLTNSALAGNLAVQRAAAAELKGEIESISSLIENSGQLTPQGGAMEIASAEDLARARELQRELTSINVSIEDGEKLLHEYNDIMVELSQTRPDITPPGRTESGGTGADEKAKRETERLKQEMDRRRQAVVSSLQTESEAAFSEYQRRNVEIQSLFEEGSAQQRDLLSRNNESYLQKLQELNAREKEEALRHQEEMAQQRKEDYAKRLQEITGFSEQAVQKLLEIQTNAGDPMAALTRNLGDAFVNLDDTIASAFMNGMQNAEGMNDILKSVGQTVAGSLLQSFIKLGVQMLINAAMGQTMQTAATSAAVTGGATALAAWQPAAIAASIATFGAAAGIGSGAYVASQAVGVGTGFMSQIAATGYASGGYTGSGSRNEPAGIVHRGEYVMPKNVVDQPGMRSHLEGLKSGQRYLSMGNSGSGASPGSGGSNIQIHIHNEGKDMEVDRTESRTGAGGLREMHVFVRNSFKGMMKDGSIDKDMNLNYGINRRGR
ncbi:phage tail tape measure protein [Halomonas sp. AOP43-A1-21]